MRIKLSSTKITGRAFCGEHIEGSVLDEKLVGCSNRGTEWSAGDTNLGSGSRVQVGDANMGVIRGDGGRRRKGHSRSISSPGEMGRTQTLPVLSNVGQEQETGKDNECQWSSNSSSRKWAQKVGSSEGRAWKNEDEETRRVCSGQTTGKAEPGLNDRLLATSQPSAVL